jgi:hypothetical protein
MVTDDAIVEAIKSHPLVGDGSCSVVNECFSREELLKMFGNRNGESVVYSNAKPRRVASVEEAVNLAVKFHKSWHSMRDDQEQYYL